MKNITLLALGLAVSTLSTGVLAEKNTQPTVYQQAYAQYVLQHPDNKAQSSKVLVQQFTQDYQPLFSADKKVNQQQFVAFEQAQLTELMKQRRDMSLKQTYVRYGILDADKDQKMTLKEFQEIGLKGFAEYDKDKDGIVTENDIKLAAGNGTATHDGFSVRLPISMPMANNPAEFIRQYGQGKPYATLGDYLTGRDKQFFETDSNKDLTISEKEYVDEFMQRYDANTVAGIEKMKALSVAKFQTMGKGKAQIQASDIQKFAKQLDREMSQ